MFDIVEKLHTIVTGSVIESTTAQLFGVLRHDDTDHLNYLRE